MRENPPPARPRSKRRKVDFSGHLVRASGEILAIEICDMSYEGCRVHAGRGLAPGERVSFSILGRGSHSAIVRWARGGEAGLMFCETNGQQVPDARTTPRTILEADIVTRRPGRNRERVEIFDASPAGCKIEMISTSRVGDLILVKFDGLESLDATVRWIEGPRMGLEFNRKMHPAVFEHLMKRLKV